MKAIRIAAVLAAVGGLGCVQAAVPIAVAPATAAADPQADLAAASVQESNSTTQHTATINGRKLNYTAVAGTLTVRDDDGKPTASMFYVAYLMDPKDTRRPVTFFYNGGPGSSTIWLHMGSFGPRRVLPEAPNFSANAPHRLLDNDDTVLPKTDIVFLDAINTGFSRPLGDSKPETFMAADADLDVFSKAIQRWLTLHQRWNSPKYLFGESYGSSRSAGLAARLQTTGAQLSGLIQLGSCLQVSRIIVQGDDYYKSNVPTYAVTAAYHGRIQRPADRTSFIREVTEWVEGPYNIALAKADRLSLEERRRTAEQMSKYVGLPAAWLAAKNLRVSPDEFRGQLLADQGKVIGELDTRFIGLEVNGQGGLPSFDPSAAGVFRPIVSLFQDYVRNELKYTPLMSYRISFRSWERFDFRRGNAGPEGYGNYGRDLANAMKSNPSLKVLSLNGLYDLSTVFYGADLDYAHLGLPPELAANIRYEYYESGHMAYVDAPVARAMSRDMQRFYDETATPR